MSAIDNLTVATVAKRDGTIRFNFFELPRCCRDAVATAEEALAEVELLDKRDTEVKNACGNKRRLALAMCLAQKPKRRLLDEPTAGMSQGDSAATSERLQRRGEGGDLIKMIIEHDMHVVFTLAEHIPVLHYAVIAHGSPEDIKNAAVVQEAYAGKLEE